MALFRRRSAHDEAEDLAGAPTADLDEASADAQGQAEVEPADTGWSRVDGPYDHSEADQADQSLPRLDLGSLLIPGLPGIGVQVEAAPNTQQVRAVTAVAQEAAVQVQAFAAPTSSGIWDEIRAEMLAELSATSGATVEEHEGPFGPELGVTPRYDMRSFLTAGINVGPPTLLRFYVLHCIFIPIAASILMILHFWRIRKDGGISGPL